jgi:signal transduction histidine kinase
MTRVTSVIGLLAGLLIFSGLTVAALLVQRPLRELSQDLALERSEVLAGTWKGPGPHTPSPLQARLSLDLDGQDRILGQARQLSLALLGLAVAAMSVTMVLVLARRHELGRADADLGDARGRFEAFIDHSPLNAYIKDSEGRMVWTSKNMRENFPVSAAWQGQRRLDGMPEAVIERLNQDIPGILAGAGPRQDEVDIPTPRGLRRLLVVRFPLSQGGVRYLGGYSMDVQDRVDAQRRLEAYARDLENTNRELQNFTSVAAHDLQEPLRKILTFGERLASALQGEAGGKALEDLGRMLSAAGRMRALIEDLLSYTRVASRPWADVDTDLDGCLRQAWADLELAVEQSGARLEADPLPSLRADPSQLRQLFVNLLGNAIKYRRSGEAPRIRVDCTAQPGRVELRVRDNGIGFDPAKAEKIFELFQRLHGRSEYPGNGLGLAICRKIAERHGGSLRAEGRPGLGSTFILSLPQGRPKQEELA